MNLLLFYVVLVKTKMLYVQYFCLFKIFVLVECTRTSRPMHNYPDLYRGSTIFVDFTFQCNGLLFGVDLYVKRSGTVYFTAWRPSASGTSWSLIGITNAIVVEGREQGGHLVNLKKINNLRNVTQSCIIHIMVNLLME